jgi:hypothetical protein
VGEENHNDRANSRSAAAQAAGRTARSAASPGSAAARSRTTLARHRALTDQSAHLTSLLDAYGGAAVGALVAFLAISRADAVVGQSRQTARQVSRRNLLEILRSHAMARSSD